MSVREEQGMTTQAQDIAARLDELERLARAASAGRWTSEEWEFDSHEEIVAYLAAMLKHSPATLIGAVRLDDEHGSVVALTGNGPTSAANAVYISAASPQDMLGLIAAYRSVVAERDRYREALTGATS